jgi:hypothetical protein
LQEDAPRKEINMSLQVGDLNLGEYINHMEILYRYVGDVERKVVIRNNVDPKVFRNGRDIKIILIHKKTPLWKNEGMCTWILQEHMHIMRNGWLTHVNPFK